LRKLLKHEANEVVFSSGTSELENVKIQNRIGFGLSLCNVYLTRKMWHEFAFDL